MENDLVRFVAQMPEGEVPAEFQLFPYGLIDVLGGNPFLVDEPGMAAAVSAFKQRGLDMVVDYEHQTLGKTEGADFSSPDGKAPAAGWIKSLDPRGKDGLWAKVEWTAKARELLASREYRYFSPVFYTSKTTGKLVAIENVALTNSPRLNSIRPIVAKHKTEGVVMELLKLIAKALGLPDTATQDEVVAKIGQIQAAGPALLKTVASAVGLSEAATEDQVIASVKSVPAKDAESKEVRTALGLPEASGKSEVIASIHALKQRPDATVLQEIASLKSRLAQRDCDELVDGALKAGKITPAQKEWAEKYALADADGFRLFVAKAPQVVPVDGAKIIGDKPNPGSLDDAQLRINKMMGIDEATFKKHNPTTAA